MDMSATSSLRANAGRSDDVRNRRMNWLSEIPLPTTRHDGRACRRAVKVGPSARASRAADAAPLTARRSRAVRCLSRGRGSCRQSDQGTTGPRLRASARRARARCGASCCVAECQAVGATTGIHTSAERPRSACRVSRRSRPACSSTDSARSISRRFLLRLFCSRTRYVPAGEVVPASTAIGAWVLPVPGT